MHDAVVDGATTLTYGEFAARSSRMAGAITQRYRPEMGDRVVVFLENCVEFLEVIYAAWTAGLCVVPVNAKLHVSEVAHIIRDSAAILCFASADKLHALSTASTDAPNLRAVIGKGDTTYMELDRGDPLRVVDRAPSDAAWIFYTSGTTGKPKGAVLTFRNLLFMAYAYYADIDRPSESDTKVHAAPLSHGSGLYSLAHMFRGGLQVILPGFDPVAVFSAIERYPSVTLFAAPTMITRLLNSDAAATADLRNLKLLYFGGGPMYISQLDRALNLFGERLFHLYGQGESPMTITGFWPRKTDAVLQIDGEQRLGSCGFARTGVEFKIVDPIGRDLPNGELGEVVTRSDCVMKEYWRNPDASAAAIKEGWLWTGDIGTVDSVGYLYLRDRSKDLIISGGSNIYPREVEEVILSSPDVLECAVVGRPHPDWGEEVCAFVVLRLGAKLDAAALDELITNRIARFKRPKKYFDVDNLPKNNYGKVLKTELRKKLQEA